MILTLLSSVLLASTTQHPFNAANDDDIAIVAKAPTISALFEGDKTPDDEAIEDALNSLSSDSEFIQAALTGASAPFDPPSEGDIWNWAKTPKALDKIKAFYTTTSITKPAGGGGSGSTPPSPKHVSPASSRSSTPVPFDLSTATLDMGEISSIATGLTIPAKSTGPDVLKNEIDSKSDNEIAALLGGAAGDVTAANRAAAITKINDAIDANASTLFPAPPAYVFNAKAVNTGELEALAKTVNDATALKDELDKLSDANLQTLSGVAAGDITAYKADVLAGLKALDLSRLPYTTPSQRQAASQAEALAKALKKAASQKTKKRMYREAARQAIPEIAAKYTTPESLSLKRGGPKASAFKAEVAAAVLAAAGHLRTVTDDLTNAQANLLRITGERDARANITPTDLQTLQDNLVQAGINITNLGNELSQRANITPTQLDDLENKLKTALSDLSKATAELADRGAISASDLANLQANFNQARTDLTTVSTELSDARTALSKAGTSTGAEKEAIQDLTAEVEALRGELKKALEKVAELSA